MAAGIVLRVDFQVFDKNSFFADDFFVGDADKLSGSYIARKRDFAVLLINVRILIDSGSISLNTLAVFFACSTESSLPPRPNRTYSHSDMPDSTTFRPPLMRLLTSGLTFIHEFEYWVVTRFQSYM